MSGFLSENNQEQNRNMFLAIALALGAIMVWQAFITPPPAGPVSDEVAATDGSGAPAAAPATPAAPTAAPATQAAAVLPPQVLRGSHHQLAITNAGARVASVTIVEPERYRPHDDIAGVFPDAEQPLLPFSVTVRGLPDLQEGTVYAWESDASSANDDGTFSRLAYQWTAPDGQIRVSRTYEVDAERPYVVRAVVTVTNQGAAERRFEGVDAHMIGAFDPKTGGMFAQNASILEALCAGGFGTRRDAAKGVDEAESFGDDAERVEFVAVDERYFLHALVPDADAGFSRCTYGPVDGDMVRVTAEAAAFAVPPGQSKSFAFTLFAGPKHGDYLDVVPGDLNRSIDLGWFSFIAVPLRAVLLFFQGLVINWGIAIVLLTFSVKLVLYPVTQRSYESMEKMKLIQPQLTELQKKYENDKQQLAMQQMELFKREGVSPLGGCLPMLAQMPIYISLYRTIWGSTELYNAPLALWIKDMSQPDPFFVLPLLLGLLMFVQNRLMPQPTGGGEMQQQMAQVQKFMPFLFTMMMLFLPSGLVLYILVNMVLSLAQMLHIRKKFAGAASAATKR